MKVREWKIDIKRYSTANIVIDPILHKKSVDITDNYGHIIFKGTHADFSKFVRKHQQDHTYFKIIGIHDIFPEPGMVECTECGGEGVDPILYSCCGDDITGSDYLICPSCKEHCGDEHNECDTCDGKGYTPKLPTT